MTDYEAKIIQLLKENGNCIDGFNNLLKLGGFNPNTLEKYLKSMKKRHLIEVTEIDRKSKRYCIPNNSFEWTATNFFNEFNSITNDLKTKDPTDKEKILLIASDIRMAFQTLGNIVAIQLYEEHVSRDHTKVQEIEKLKSDIWKRIELNLEQLSVNDRIKVLSALITKPTPPLSLDEYRKTHQSSSKIPTGTIRATLKIVPPSEKGAS